MWKKLVNLAIYISLCIDVPRDHRNSTPNLYKQGMMPIDQIEEDERSRETEKGPVQHPSENNLGTSTTDYFSAKKTKSNNCLPYTCLICHISKQTNKFHKTFFFFFLIEFYTFCKYIHHR